MIKILDCTLRDGGYVNNFEFGKNRIKNIIKSLEESNIDIIECGFLSNKGKDTVNNTLYENESRLKNLNLNKNAEHSLMINMGEFDINTLNKKTCIDIIRLAFHKLDYKKAIKQANIIQKKGYKVYLQPTNTSSYSIAEYTRLLKLAVKAKVNGVYIVDTLGVMFEDDFVKYYKLAEKILPLSIVIGFHFHNNYQLAFSNAIKAISLKSKHNIIVDSSLNGMGRGAGNVPTELIICYLNKAKYKFKNVVQCIYTQINPLKRKYVWGYNVPQLIAAEFNCHPNFINYLINNGVNDYESIHKTISLILPKGRLNYKADLIEKILK